MKPKHASLLTVAFALAIAVPAAAQEAGMYAGASLGQSKVNIDTSDFSRSLTFNGIGHGAVSADETDTGWKVYLGYRINRHFAVEGGYVDLGEFSTTTTVTSLFGFPITPQTLRATITTKDGLHIAGLAGVPIGTRFSLFGKVGLYSMKTETRFSGFFASDSDRDEGLLFGLGGSYDLTKNASIRAEWERFSDVGSDRTGEGDVDFMSVGVMFRF